MNAHLWAGPELKREYAHFHLGTMIRVLGPADWTDDQTVQLNSGAIVDRGQQPTLYPHFDAFLGAVHAIPDVIQCCFGRDKFGDLRLWFKALSPGEQARRKEFSRRLKPLLYAFRALPLSGTRNTTVHRLGYPPVASRHTGRFGVVHEGTPTRHIPTAETSPHVPPLPMMASATPIELRAEDFTIDGRPLLTVCTEYLEEAAGLIAAARSIEAAVHGASPLTSPPDA